MTVLRTALRPKSLAVLVVCLGIATAFVLLSRWQLSSSQDAQTVYDPAKEVVQPIQEAIPAGEPALASFADQAVVATGSYLPDSTVLIEDRLQDGHSGWWVVEALTVDDSAAEWPEAGQDLVLPVVRGWVADPQQGWDAELPEGEVAVVGRYLPPEGPLSTEDQDSGLYRTLSPAQLTNVWNAPVYSGFVTAEGESSGADQAQIDDDGTLPGDGTLLTDDVAIVQVDQQPTDTSVNWLNVFYAVEWLIFAAFALWIWFRSVLDDYRRETDPDSWFMLDGEETTYYWDEQTGRYFYYDPVAEAYYFFDDQPAPAEKAMTRDDPAR